MISFRLTAEEYDRFRELCFLHGIRSVSEMARAAINMLLQQPDRAPHESLETRVSELEGRLHLLSLELKKLNQIATSNAALPALTFAQSSPGA
jgi:hypothetical protein